MDFGAFGTRKVKKIPLHLKLRQLVLAAMLVVTSVPVRGSDKDYYPNRCLMLFEKVEKIKTGESVVERARKEKEEAQKVKDGEIRKAQDGKARPLNVDEKLLAHYMEHPEEVEAWLEDIEIRKDHALVTDTEEMTSLAVVNEYARGTLATLLSRRNVTVRYSSWIGSIVDWGLDKFSDFFPAIYDQLYIFGLRRDQASVDRSSYIPLFIWRIVKGFDGTINRVQTPFGFKVPVPQVWSLQKAKSYSRAFTITLQRQVPEREKNNLDLFPRPNTSVYFENYQDTTANALFTAKVGSDPDHILQDLNQEGTAIVAAGQAVMTNGKVILTYEPATSFIPLNNIARQIIYRIFPTALQIANSPEDVATAEVNEAYVNKLELDVNQKALANFYGVQDYMNRLADRTALNEIPKSIGRKLKNGALAFIAWFVGHNLVVGLFPAAAGKYINGKNIKTDSSCHPTPGRTEWDAVMVDHPKESGLSPFLPVFVAPDARNDRKGKINPCDPHSEVQKALKDIGGQEFVDAWEPSHAKEMAELRAKIRAAYLYQGDDPPSACAVYYTWFTRCQAESN
jgi:hypothetical protein